MGQKTFRFLVTVRAKLFVGFCALSMIIVCLGSSAIFSLSRSGDSVRQTFDRPVMALNFARTASQLFNEIEIKTLKAQLETDGIRPVYQQDVLDLLDIFQVNLNIAKAESFTQNTDPMFDQVLTQTHQWKTVIVSTDDPVAQRLEFQRLTDEIQMSLDSIVAAQSREAFKYRADTLAKISKAKIDSLIVSALALIVTAIISAWVALTITKPLRSAAEIARKISSGKLVENIPLGGDDETGALLNSMSVMQTNIRAQMSTEQNLRAVAQTRLAESLENSKDAILMADREGKIIVANQQFRTVFPKVEIESLCQKSARVTKGLYTDYFEENGVPLDGLSEYYAEDREIRFQEGQWARINASTTNEGGRLIIWTDITQAKERNVRLMLAKEQAEAAAKSKSLFLAAMSHELRTPLNAVIGFSQIIQSQSLGRVGNPRYVEMARLISQSGEHLLNIVKDVLSIANGQDGDPIETNMAPVNIAEIVRYCVDTVTPDAEQKSIRLICQTDLPKALVMGDRQSLRQALLNILSNALKFNHPGGAVRVNLDVGRKGAIRIDVIDNGIGIDAADLERIQEPFVQVDNGITRKYEGAGLGLSIVKQLVCAHGGELKMASRLEKGTRVSLIFPGLASQSQYSTLEAA